jgi:formyl-CoA transferase
VFPKLSATPGNVRWAGPKMGEHNDYVFGDVLGYAVDRIEGLKAAGVI